MVWGKDECGEAARTPLPLYDGFLGIKKMSIVSG